MKILVTGAKGFVGKNLCAALKNIRDGKDRRFPALKIEGIYEYDIDSTPKASPPTVATCPSSRRYIAKSVELLITLLPSVFQKMKSI
jgi:hypothetical protein